MRDEERPRGVAGPVIVDIHRRIGTLQRRRGHLRELLDRHEAMPREAQERNERRASFDREEMAALDSALGALGYHWRELEGEGQATLHLGALVDALRACEAASHTSRREAREEAQALLDEAFRGARTFIDNIEHERGGG